AVDQGGAAETTHPTSISNPTYKKYGVIHCAVTNLPALTSRTSSHALSQVVSPYVQVLAKKKSVEAILIEPKFRGAVNVHGGEILHPGVLQAMGYPT
ncbi:MAG: alanine dehydrogenase, partial [bacterium]|nr:alanine dehydrogenase [bacterium]